MQVFVEDDGLDAGEDLVWALRAGDERLALPFSMLSWRWLPLLVLQMTQGVECFHFWLATGDLLHWRAGIEVVSWRLTALEGVSAVRWLQWNDGQAPHPFLFKARGWTWPHSETACQLLEHQNPFRTKLVVQAGSAGRAGPVATSLCPGPSVQLASALSQVCLKIISTQNTLSEYA